MRATSSSISAVERFGAATRLTKPFARASSAEMKSPVTSISNASLRGTLRDSATPGVEQNRPTLTPLTAKRASLRRDGQVAHRDELAAGRGGDALHARDHRHRQALDRQHHRARTARTGAS